VKNLQNEFTFSPLTCKNNAKTIHFHFFRFQVECFVAAKPARSSQAREHNHTDIQTMNESNICITKHIW
jgi:hypothetical protein